MPFLPSTPWRVRLSLLGVACLGACVNAPTPLSKDTTPAYVAPAGVATARLLMRGSLQKDEHFAVYALDDALRCSGPRRLGSGTAAQQPAPAALAAGMQTTLDFVFMKPPSQVCLVRWTFTPQAGRSYAVQGGAAGTSCRAVVLDTTEPDRVRPADGAVRRNTTGQPCLPLDKAPGLHASPLDGGQSNGEAVLYPSATTADLEGLIRR